MSQGDLDKEIVDAVDQLIEDQDQDHESVLTIPQELISQNIMSNVNWPTFPFDEYTGYQDDQMEDDWVAQVNKWFADKDEKWVERRRASLAYSVIRTELVGQAYRERRKARSKDPERKLRNKLLKAEQKMKRLEEERREIMAQQQAVARSRQVRQARSETGSQLD